jgi:hypothetical protein
LELISFYPGSSSRFDAELWQKLLNALVRNLQVGKEDIREMLTHLDKE